MSAPNHGLPVFVTFHIQARHTAEDIAAQQEAEWEGIRRGNPVGIAEFQPVTEESFHRGYWLAEKPGEDRVNDTVARLLVRRLGESMEESLGVLTAELSEPAILQDPEHWNLRYGMTRIKDPAYIKDGSVLPLKDKENPEFPLYDVGFVDVHVMAEGLTPAMIENLKKVFDRWAATPGLPKAALSEKEARFVHNRQFDTMTIIEMLANPARLDTAVTRARLKAVLPEGAPPQVVRL
jgi:hypothetical protein